jgi:phosphohistidine phosphatase
MGKWLASEGLVPDHVVSSPAERAKQTTLGVCQQLGIAASAVRWDPRVYAAGLDGLLQALADCPAKAKTVLLVGHNPGLETLVVHLCGDVPVPADGKLLPTAAVAVLKVAGDWSAVKPGAATLVSVTRPDAVELD